MARRRFLPLIALTLLGTIVLVARLAVLQIGQHEIWAAEAAGLVRKGRIVPYVRGEIRDRGGVPMAVDQRLYQVEFNYREFRRGHVVGLVAHARSALELRAVPLEEALAELLPWARALVELTPGDLDAFGRGEGVSTEYLEVRPGEVRLDMRRGRARDLGFYLAELTGLDRNDRKTLRKLPGPQRQELSFLAFAAQRRGIEPPEMLDRLERDWTESVQFLAELARLRASAEPDRSAPDDGRPDDPLEALVLDLEDRRRRVEDLAAADLFGAAAGFPAGRLEPAELARTFDLGWLAGRLRWDAGRTEQWIVASRREWLASRDAYLLPRLVLEMVLEWRESGDATCVLDELASLYAVPDVDRTGRAKRGGVQAAESAWSTPRQLLVFGELDRLFAVPAPRRRGAAPPLPVLPFEDPAILAHAAAGVDGGFEALALAESWTGPDGPVRSGAELAQQAAQWRELLGRGRRDDIAVRCKALLDRWESRFGLALEERLAGLREHAAERGVPAPLPLARARLDRAQERADYSLIDRGSRTVLVMREPTYEVVHLLTRWPERFRGFGVRMAHRRAHVAEDDRGRPIAAGLTGEVRMPRLDELRVQRDQVERFERLRRLGQRDVREAIQLEHLVRSIDRPDEWRGAGGLEGYFDRELSGRNGYSESGGLQERVERGLRFSQQDVGKVDGLPIVSTLDLALQTAATTCLENPDLDPDPQFRDTAWEAAPTGAIVLLVPDGQVLAAASVPVLDRSDEPDSTRDEGRERTLTKPDFQPAGSVFKPFVAAFALDRLGLDPAHAVECSVASNGGRDRAGYKGLGCWREYGHGEVNLRSALKGSCNSYFAWLGEAHYDQPDFQALAEEFGFGQPTGVRTFGTAGRSGLYEDYVPQLFRGFEFRTRNYLEAGNGLGIVEATPMQVARAMAGLATGRLPEVRLVRSVGGQAVPARGRPISLSAASLDRVREAMLAVTNETGGTAQKALSADELGFRMASKTGSADLSSKGILFPDGRERVLKHTWVAGWFPPERPVGVLVVFVHRTTFTSSHNAVWIARQFLRSPAMRAWLAEAGVIE